MFRKLLKDLVIATKKKNKKILIIGNKPLDKSYANIIDNYDIVLRCSQSYYEIHNNENFRKKYGTKIDYLFLNYPMWSIMRDPEYSKGKHFYYTMFGKKFLYDFRNLLIEHPVKIISYCDNLQKKGGNKPVMDAYDCFLEPGSPRIIHKKHKELLDKLNKKYNTKFETDLLCAGVFLILYLFLNNINFDILGFSSEGVIWENSYANLVINDNNQNIIKNKNNKVIGLKLHNVNTERAIIKFFSDNNYIKNIE